MRGFEQGSRLTIALRTVKARSGACVFVVFHRVWDGEDVATDMGMPLSEFEAFLDRLSARYTLMQAGEAFIANMQGRLPRNGVVMTFDDGYEDMHSVIAPALETRELPASFFIASRFIDSEQGLSTRQLRDLASNPLIEIGGHTRTHPHLAVLEYPQQLEEVAGNKADLESLIGEKVISFAYPYGRRTDIDRSAVKAVKEAGYLGACTTESLQYPAWSVLFSYTDSYLTTRFATNRTDPLSLCATIDFLLSLS